MEKNMEKAMEKAWKKPSKNMCKKSLSTSENFLAKSSKLGTVSLSPSHASVHPPAYNCSEILGISQIVFTCHFSRHTKWHLLEAFGGDRDLTRSLHIGASQRLHLTLNSI